MDFLHVNQFRSSPGRDDLEVGVDEKEVRKYFTILVGDEHSEVYFDGEKVTSVARLLSKLTLEGLDKLPDNQYYSVIAGLTPDPMRHGACLKAIFSIKVSELS